MLWAEAKNELNDLDGAKGLVNLVRARVSLTGISPADKSAMSLAIEKERRLELAFEGHRWFDLLRTNRAIDVMRNQKDGSGNSLNYAVNQNKLVLPIPQEEMDRNSKVTQNPGY
ncbi:SusD family protein [compost metagenome]